ncbi:SDR family oxidoreductase [Streptomyces dangxiongensis]|uniref:SDR family oxidoreductase n=1 Tax=Streptomyces dangxiongensis TaxID=1442032 RepID=UPI00267D2507
MRAAQSARVQHLVFTGGTGTLGSLVVPLLRQAGHEVRILTRHGRGPGDGIEYHTCDLLQGGGLSSALDGVETVLHLAGGPRGPCARPSSTTWH